MTASNILNFSTIGNWGSISLWGSVKFSPATLESKEMVEFIPAPLLSLSLESELLEYPLVIEELDEELLV